jgi:hypothetical protein
VIQILHELGMAPEDIRALVAAGDPVVVHRFIELHAERLAERLADQLQTLIRLERTLTNTTLGHGSASRRPPWQPGMASKYLDATRTCETEATPGVPSPTRRVRWARSGLEGVTQEVSDGPQ